MSKRIEFIRDSREFDAYLNEEYIGTFRTRPEAQAELDRLAFEKLSRGNA